MSCAQCGNPHCQEHTRPVTGLIPRRGPDGRWQRGTSGNPTGKPSGAAGLAERCRKATRDGAALVKLMIAIVHGDEPEATVSDKIKAASWLADRAYGKPVITSTCELSGSLPEPRLSNEELAERVNELLERMRKRKKAGA